MRNALLMVLMIGLASGLEAQRGGRLTPGDSAISDSMAISDGLRGMRSMLRLTQTQAAFICRVNTSAIGAIESASTRNGYHRAANALGSCYRGLAGKYNRAQRATAAQMALGVGGSVTDPGQGFDWASVTIGLDSIFLSAAIRDIGADPTNCAEAWILWVVSGLWPCSTGRPGAIKTVTLGDIRSLAMQWLNDPQSVLTALRAIEAR